MLLHRLALLVAAAVLLRAGHAARLTMSWAPQLISHVHTCWAPPKNITRADDIEARIEFKLKRDGTLAGEPSVVEVTKHPLSKAFTNSIVKAIKTCQPYSLLPVDQYKGGWDKLDMSFSTDSDAKRERDRVLLEKLHKGVQEQMEERAPANSTH
jgi:hypothetical protein